MGGIDGFIGAVTKRFDDFVDGINDTAQLIDIQLKSP